MSHDNRPRACSSSHPSECRLRIVLIGNSGVGKSSLLNKYIDNKFEIYLMNTCGIDFKTKTLRIEDKTVQLHIWDTAGQERFFSVTPSYCRNANGIILMYDITESKTFDGINFWVSRLADYSPPNVEMLLLGSKLDLKSDRVVSTEMGEEAARRIKAPFFEVSALTGENIEEAIEALVRVILNRQGFLTLRQNLVPDPDVIDPSKEKRMRRDSRGGCCNQSIPSSK